MNRISACTLALVFLGCSRKETLDQAPATPSQSADTANRDGAESSPSQAPNARGGASDAGLVASGRLLPVVAVWYVPGMPRPDDPEPWQRKLVVAVSQSGRVVFSKDRARGGKPFFEASMDSAGVERMRSALSDAGFFTARKRQFVWPDHAYDVMATRVGRQTQLMHSILSVTQGFLHANFSINFM
jgi:hypothetical protein